MINLEWPEPYRSKDERDLDRMIEANIDYQEHERDLPIEPVENIEE